MVCGRAPPCHVHAGGGGCRGRVAVPCRTECIDGYWEVHREHQLCTAGSPHPKPAVHTQARGGWALSPKAGHAKRRACDSHCPIHSQQKGQFC
eukprot:362721-Chlamydomonas_euryale.AAC.2